MTIYKIYTRYLDFWGHMTNKYEETEFRSQALNAAVIYMADPNCLDCWVYEVRPDSSEPRRLLCYQR